MKSLPLVLFILTFASCSMFTKAKPPRPVQTWEQKLAIDFRTQVKEEVKYMIEKAVERHRGSSTESLFLDEDTPKPKKDKDLFKYKQGWESVKIRLKITLTTYNVGSKLYVKVECEITRLEDNIRKNKSISRRTTDTNSLIDELDRFMKLYH